jgi:pimeloyl-ACP methyl ester carboxylesterase
MYSERCKFLGSGAIKVVALHGWFSDRRAYQAIWPFLNRNDFTWAFLDWRGYGSARALAGEHTMDEIASDVLGLIDELKWSTVSLVGHSMGGKAIQRVFTKAPERVNCLVGISPVPAGVVPFDEEGWALFSNAAEDPANRREILDMTTGRRLPRCWLDEMVENSLACSDRKAFADYLIAWAKTDFIAEVEGKQIPFLAIAGQHDPALGPETMRQTILTSYPKASLEVIGEAGHYAMDETPLLLVSLVEKYLAEINEKK